MVVWIGGPARSGKGLLARKLAADLEWPLLSLDVLKMALSRVVPDLGIDPEAPSATVGEAMWPLIRAMAENAIETDVDYVFEGDMLSPRHLCGTPFRIHPRSGPGGHRREQSTAPRRGAIRLSVLRRIDGF